VPSVAEQLVEAFLRRRRLVLLAGGEVELFTEVRVAAWLEGG
jgi:hypothetical protein